ncbi:hypothetical protein TUBRATIS_11130 [Tubulinosema ratisbonensis]|uniref:Uncharacterized protein n=1 Tax=Tubulinosema ratisbonensis TaxID=291195 RepID=A0A437AMR6_9MICR|nr:hypothetical protein TUBRATIS_11130 [Tubulinosema ratisbonensis]
MINLFTLICMVIFLNPVVNSPSQQIDFNSKFAPIYQISKFKSRVKSELTFPEYSNRSNTSLLWENSKLIEVYNKIQTNLKTKNRYTNFEHINVKNNIINPGIAWESLFKDYLFDVKGVFDSIDIKNIFLNKFFLVREPDDILSNYIAEYFFDFITYENSKNENNLFLGKNSEESLELCIRNFKHEYNRHLINGKKLYDGQCYCYLRVIFENIENFNRNYFLPILKYQLERLLTDEGYKIIFILFPELLFLINYSLDIDFIIFIKKIHILIGFIAIRVQSNLQKIKSEISILKTSKTYLLHHSDFLNNFIYKTRLYTSLMIYTPKLSAYLHSYFIFLAFLSYLRIHFPNFFTLLSFDDYFCSNISTLRTILFYSSEFFQITCVKNYNKKILELTEFKIKTEFLDVYKENFNSGTFNILINNLFDFNNESLCFENIYEFRNSLIKETFLSAVEFFENEFD